MTVAVCLVDVGCRLGAAYLHNLALALSVVSQGAFARAEPHGYGIGATCRVAARLGDVAPGEWLMGFWPTPDVPDALGYHDETPAGCPVLHVFPTLDPHADPAVTASHELWEALADPGCQVTVVGPDGRIRAREPADPVETTAYPFRPSGGTTVQISNWVTPAYFDPPAAGGVPLDHLGLVHHPGEILVGGYQIFYDPHKGWTEEVHGTKRPYRQAVAAASRADRRRRRAAGKPPPGA